MFDGLFEKALLGYLSGDAEAAVVLAERVRWLLPRSARAHRRPPEPPASHPPPPVALPLPHDVPVAPSWTAALITR